MRLRNLGVSVGLVSMVASACAGGHPRRPLPVGQPPQPTTTAVTAAGPSPTPTTGPPAKVKLASLALTPFPSCPAFLAAVRSEAAAEVTPYGLPQWMGVPGGVQPGAMRVDNAAGPAAMPSAAAGSSSSGAAAAAAPSSSFSVTNNQEAGVDEMDTSKTDGRLLVALRDGPSGQQVEVTDVSSSPARLRGSAVVPNSYGGGLFLVGSDVVVISPDQQGTAVRVYSLANPDQPRLIRTFSVTGQQVAARLVGHSIKLVVSSMPSITFPPPSDPQPAGSAAALARNKAIIAGAPLSAWLPSVTDGQGHQHLAACGSVSHPADRSGVATISVLSIDPDKDQPGAPVTVLGDPGIVYASTSDLYVATASFDQQQAMTTSQRTPDAKTLIHQFDITSPAQAVYRGSGAVKGELLNQYALSEYNGDLRVATTTGTPQPPPFEGGPVPAADGSESFVTVLRPSAGTLVTVGQVGGLGRTQRIYGVRFVGPLGYVVTFQQMDPLYIVDLSKPTAPLIKGALELTGYSAYMHPLSDGRLLGVGASATPEGHRLGLQVSLFDVANPSRPALLGQSKLASAYAGVENDPHAFLWWARSGIVVLPLQVCCDPSQSQPFTGAVVYRIGTASVTEVGRLSQPAQAEPQAQPSGGPGAPTPPQPGGGGGSIMYQPAAQIQRVFVAGSRLVSVSERGVMLSDLATFAPVTWLPYP